MIFKRKIIAFCILASAFLASSAFALDTGVKNPFAAAQEASPTTSWTNLPDSVFTSDNRRVVYTGTSSDSLYVTFDDMNLHPQAIITAIIIASEANGSAAAASRRELLYHITVDGTTIANGSDAVTFGHDQTTDNTITLSGTTDSLWGISGLTGADFNTGTVGVVVWKISGSAGTISLDHTTMTVHYTFPELPEEYRTTDDSATAWIEDSWLNYASQTSANGGTNVLKIGTAVDANNMHRIVIRPHKFSEFLIYNTSAHIWTCTLWVTPTINFGTTVGDSMHIQVGWLTTNWVESGVSYDNSQVGLAWTTDGGDFIIPADSIFVKRVHADSLEWKVNAVVWDTVAIADGDSLPIVLTNFHASLPADPFGRFVDKYRHGDLDRAFYGVYLRPDSTKGLIANRLIEFASTENATAVRRPQFQITFARGVDRQYNESHWINVYTADSVSTTGTAKTIDTMIIDEPGDWIIFYTGLFEVQSITDEGRAHLIYARQNEIIRRINIEAPTVVSNRWYPISWMLLHRKHNFFPDTFFVEIKNSASAKTVMRKRDFTAMNLLHYGIEGKDWFYKEVQTFAVDATSFTTNVTHSFETTTAGTWLVMNQALMTTDGNLEEIFYRLQIVNIDEPATLTVNDLNMHVEQPTDTLPIGSYYVATIGADTAYEIRTQYKVSTGENGDIFNDALFMIRTDAFVTFAFDSNMAVSSGSGTARATLTQVPTLDPHTGTFEDIIVLGSQGALLSALTGGKGYIKHFQDGTVYDTSWWNSRVIPVEAVDTIAQFGHFTTINGSIVTDIDAELYGLEATAEYQNSILIMLGKSSTVTTGDWVYRTGNDSAYIDDAHIYEGAVDTKYGAADSITLGGVVNDDFNVLFRDKSIQNELFDAQVPTKNIFTRTDSLFAAYLYLYPKTLPVEDDTVAIDIGYVTITGWNEEANVTWDSACATCAIEVEWTTPGGDYIIVAEERIRFIGAAGGLARVEIDGVFWDTVGTDRHIPIPIPNVAIDKMTGGSNNAIIFVTDTALSTNSSIVSFHSIQADSSHYRPYFVYLYDDGGLEVHGLAPAAGHLSDPRLIVIGDLLNGVYETGNMVENNKVDLMEQFDETFLQEAVPDAVNSIMNNAFLGYTSAGNRIHYIISLRTVDSLVPSDRTIDSAMLEFLPTRIFGTKGTETDGNAIYPQISDLRRIFREASTNAPNWTLAVDGTNAADTHSTVNTVSWTIPGGYNQSSDQFAPFNTSAQVRQYGPRNNYTVDSIAHVDSGWRDSLVPYTNGNALNNATPFFIKIPGSYFQEFDDDQSPTSSSASIYRDHVTNDFVPKGLIVWMDTAKGVSGDRTWNIKYAASEAAKSTQGVRIILFLSEASSDGKPTRRRRMRYSNIEKDTTYIESTDIRNVMSNYYLNLKNKEKRR